MKLWQAYIKEDDKKKDLKIHPKVKSGMSFAAVAPIDDILAAGATVTTLTNKNTSIKKKAETIGMLGAGLAAYGVYRYVRAFLDKCTKRCGTYSMNTPKRQLCMLSCKSGSLRKKIQLLENNKRKLEKLEKTKKVVNTLNTINKMLPEAIKQYNESNKKIILYKEYLKKHPPKKETKGHHFL